MVPPFGAGFLYIGSGAVGGICHMYAVGVDCCLFLMMIGLSDVCDDDSKNQNDLLLFLVCLDSLFSKDSRVKCIMNCYLQDCFHLIFPFLRYSTLPIPSMYGIYIYQHLP